MSADPNMQFLRHAWDVWDEYDVISDEKITGFMEDMLDGDRDDAINDFLDRESFYSAFDDGDAIKMMELVKKAFYDYAEWTLMQGAKL